MIKIVVAGVSGCLGSAFTGLVDILTLARDAIAHASGAEAPFCVVTAAAGGGEIVDGAGRRFAVTASFEEISACEAILVPGLYPDATGLPASSAHHAAFAAWIRRQHARGALVGASGAGVFLLGEAGLLDGRRFAGAWGCLDEIERRYPRADAARGAALIEDRRVVTAASPLGWIDLALHTMRALCGEAAARVAEDATIAAAADRRAYRPQGYLSNLDPFLNQAQQIVRQAGASALSTLDLARALSTSERTLHRRLKQASGESPKAFIDRVRVENAQTLLETSPKSVKELAAEAGFLDEASFRRAFRRIKGVAPGAYRALARARSQGKGQAFAVQKNASLIPEMFAKILDSCVNGVTLADPDQPDAPIVYANAQFQRMTGYGLDEIIGQNCRFLQGTDRSQHERARLREAIEKREKIEVILRNYRKDGSMFFNKLNISPLLDADGRALYLLGVQYDASAQVQGETELGDLRAQLAALAGSIN